MPINNSKYRKEGYIPITIEKIRINTPIKFYLIILEYPCIGGLLITFYLYF